MPADHAKGAFTTTQQSCLLWHVLDSAYQLQQIIAFNALKAMLHTKMSTN